MSLYTVTVWKPLHDVVAALRGGVLPGDGYLARQPLGLQRLDGADRGSVVGGDDRVDLVVLRGKDVLHDLGGCRGIPVVHPLIGNDLDLAFVDEGLQDLHLAVADQIGVVVGRASAQEHEVARGQDLDDSAGLGASDFGVVEGDVGGDVRWS